jgi:hypothetical protein
MTGESDRDLPLHDEAKARAKWRGDETILKEGAQGGDAGGPKPGDAVLEDLAGRPPD